MTVANLADGKYGVYENGHYELGYVIERWWNCCFSYH